MHDPYSGTQVQYCFTYSKYKKYWDEVNVAVKYFFNCH